MMGHDTMEGSNKTIYQNVLLLDESSGDGKVKNEHALDLSFTLDSLHLALTGGKGKDATAIPYFLVPIHQVGGWQRNCNTTIDNEDDAGFELRVSLADLVIRFKSPQDLEDAVESLQRNHHRGSFHKQDALEEGWNSGFGAKTDASPRGKGKLDDTCNDETSDCLKPPASVPRSSTASASKSLEDGMADSTTSQSDGVIKQGLRDSCLVQCAKQPVFADASMSKEVAVHDEAQLREKGHLQNALQIISDEENQETPPAASRNASANSVHLDDHMSALTGAFDHEDIISSIAPMPPVLERRQRVPEQQTAGAFPVYGVDNEGIRDAASYLEESTTDEDPMEDDMAISAELVEALFVGNRGPNTRSSDVTSHAEHDESAPSATRGGVLLVEAKPLEIFFSRRAAFVLLCVVIVVVVALILGLVSLDDGDLEPSMLETETLFPSSAPSMSPTATPLPTLQQIQEEGVLRCGMNSIGYNFVQVARQALNKNNHTGPPYTAFAANLCEAIAAAALGRNYSVEVVSIDLPDSAEALANRTIDVLISKPESSVQKDVFNPASGKGITVSPAYYYDGLGFGGRPEYVACADDDIRTFFNCSDIKICIAKGHRFVDSLSKRVPGDNLLVASTGFESLALLQNGTCNVIAGHLGSLSEFILRSLGLSGDYMLGRKTYAKDYYAFMTRDSDLEWSTFSSTVLQGLIAADKHNITSMMAADIGTSNMFGEAYQDFFIHAIEAVGNYGEIWDRSVGLLGVPRGINSINNGTSGLLMTLPFGPTQVEGPGPSWNGTISRILERGYLRCGVQTNRPGFALANWQLNSSSEGSMEAGLHGSSEGISGIDVDFCRALAASLFSSQGEDVVFAEITDEQEGYVLLSSGKLDVLSGATWTAQNEAREPTTGQSYSFSMPYFYNPFPGNHDERFGDNLCLATPKTDQQWSSFVYWIAASIVHAEEEGISQRFSSSMPIINLFGPQFSRAFRDAIHAVGNYEEMYDRNLASIIPRTGRNDLNPLGNPGPELYVLPDLA